MRYFNLLSLNPWPVLMSKSVFLMFVGMVKMLYCHKFMMVFLGLSFVVMISFCWFKEMVLENFLGAHNSIMGRLMRGGMVLFITSEVMFFSGFFWSFFYSSMNPYFNNIEVFDCWPPYKAIDVWTVPFINTLLLVCSGVTLTWGHHILLEKTIMTTFMKFFIHLSFFFTMALGVTFEVFQFEEYLSNFFSMSSTKYGSKFYMLTGFHGFHVLMGLLMLFIAWIRYGLGHFKSVEHNHLLLGAWYWHFVDVVWLFLFLFVYFLYNDLLVPGV